ncbi:outer membrane porin GjpA [Mycobacterium sp. SVM_VP21]|nr:outer membrane porin GjpA [Mycobacterium sp. SVM_VP21]
MGHLPGLPTLREVTLTAGDTLPDLLAPWIDQLNTASADATTLLNNFFLAPGVGLQQFLANQSNFWQQVLDDPSNITAVTNQVQENLVALLTGYGLQNASSATTTTVLQHTLQGGIVGGHAVLFGQIPGYLPADQVATLTPIIDFLGSPASGIIMGALGPAISPWIALLNSVTDGDDFNTTLANMVGAYFNGATLNLDSLLPAINGAGVFPTGMTMDHLDFAFGGLLSPGGVTVGPYGVDGTDVAVPAVGGSIFNSVGLHFSGVPVIGNLDAPSQAIGPIGAWEALGQTIGALLGSGWTGYGAVDVSPPALGIELPTIPSDFFDDGGVSGSLAADSVSWLQDLMTGLFG